MSLIDYEKLSFDIEDIYKILHYHYPVNVSTTVDGIIVNFIYKPHNSNRMIVMSPGAKSKEFIPEYQRISYLDSIESNVLIFSDPTWDFGSKIGWMQGTPDFYAIELIVRIIDNILSSVNYELYFFGSSAGGFTSINLASYFENSTAIAINPQTNILDYNQKQYVNSLIVKNFMMTEEEYDTKFFGRHNLINVLIRNKLPKIYYFQNISDEKHYKEHYIPFQNS